MTCICRWRVHYLLTCRPKLCRTRARLGLVGDSSACLGFNRSVGVQSAFLGFKALGLYIYFECTVNLQWMYSEFECTVNYCEFECTVNLQWMYSEFECTRANQEFWTLKKRLCRTGCASVNLSVLTVTSEKRRDERGVGKFSKEMSEHLATSRLTQEEHFCEIDGHIWWQEILVQMIPKVRAPVHDLQCTSSVHKCEVRRAVGTLVRTKWSFGAHSRNIFHKKWICRFHRLPLSGWNVLVALLGAAAPHRRD